MSKRKIVVRNSPIHGRGVFAARAIAKGEKIIEYKGERITWAQADRRPPSDPDDPNHTFLFALESGKHVIDAAVGGNAARWINHACAPNCETEESADERVFVEALRDIRAGEELFYDYGLIIEERITPALKAQYRCRCGARQCRGTMLALPTPRPAAAKGGAKRAAKAAKRADKPAAKRADMRADMRADRRIVEPTAKRTSERTRDRTEARADRMADKRTDKRADKRGDKRTDKRADQRADRRIDRRTLKRAAG